MAPIFCTKTPEAKPDSIGLSKAGIWKPKGSFYGISRKITTRGLGDAAYDSVSVFKWVAIGIYQCDSK